LRETWNGILPDSLIVPLRWNCNMVWCVCRCGALDCQLCAWLLFRALANKACTIRHVWCRRVWGAVRWQGQVGNTFGKPLVSFLIKYVVMLIGISQISFISHLRFWKREQGQAGKFIMLSRTMQSIACHARHNYDMMHIPWYQVRLTLAPPSLGQLRLLAQSRLAVAYAIPIRYS